MAQNFNLGELGQFVTTNVTSNTITFVANTSQLVLANNIALVANASNGTSGQVLTSNGSAVYWSTASAGVNVAAQYAWTNTQSFANAVTFNSGANLVISSGALIIDSTGSQGTAGQVLTSNGTGNVYWSTASASVNLASSYAFTNTTASGNATSGAITTTGGIGVANNLYVGGRVGFSNSINVSVAYYQYNQTTNSIDLLFGQ